MIMFVRVTSCLCCIIRPLWVDDYSLLLSLLSSIIHLTLAGFSVSPTPQWSSVNSWINTGGRVGSVLVRQRNPVSVLRLQLSDGLQVLTSLI